MVLAWLDQFWRDVRIGVRVLLKSPLFTSFAVLVLAIGIGANVAVFTSVNAIFLRPLEVPEPGEWATAIELAKQHGVWPTARALHLDHSRLKRRRNGCPELCCNAHRHHAVFGGDLMSPDLNLRTLAERTRRFQVSSRARHQIHRCSRVGCNRHDTRSGLS
jgi:hypothetical protein